LKELKGIYAFVTLSADDPQKIVAVREGAPLVVGSVDGEGFIASDMPALLPYTRSILFLDDQELVVVARDGIRFSMNRENRKSQSFRPSPGIRSRRKRAATSISC
jgi:glucosamine--fructose-6-phosphate aminotransferase (isomerizing)